MVNFMLCVYFTTIKKLGEKMIVSKDGQDAEKAECCCAARGRELAEHVDLHY